MDKKEITEDQSRMRKFFETGEPIELDKGKLAVLFLEWGAVLAIGIVCLMALITPENLLLLYSLFLITGILATNVNFWIILFLFISISGITGFLAVITINKLLRKHGAGVLKFSIIFVTILIWIIAIVLIIFLWSAGAGYEAFWWLLGPAFYTFVLIISFTKWKPALRRAGKILKLTGQVVHEEKELIVPSILKIFLIGILSSFLGIIDLYIMTQIFAAGANEIVVWIIGIIIFFCETFYLSFNSKVLTGVSYTIAYIWYRNKDPKLRDGFAVALYQMGDIAIFSLLHALIETIKLILNQLASKSGKTNPWTAAGFRLASGIIGTIWFYMNYFTLPSIVIEDKPTTKAIASSAYRLYDNFADVFMRETGVKMAFNLLTFLMIVIFAAGGAVFGLVIYWAYVFPLMGYIPDMTIMIILIILAAVLFIFVSTLITRPMFMMYNDVYMAFLFGFILDKESGFQLPVRLPENILDEWKAWYEHHPPIRRCPKCNMAVQPGDEYCPKCGARIPLE
ncbi:MAG: zinc-ribbon domain-containing protein [Candidatus Helarchaeota archaeon]